jgi:hypothetical protein
MYHRHFTLVRFQRPVRAAILPSVSQHIATSSSLNSDRLASLDSRIDIFPGGHSGILSRAEPSSLGLSMAVGVTCHCDLVTWSCDFCH